MNTLLAQTTSTQQQANDILAEIEKVFTFWKGKDPLDVLRLVIDFMLILLAGLAVIFAIWSGYQYITSAGDPEKAEAGRRSLTYVVVGIVVAVLSVAAVFAVNATVLELAK